MDTSENKKRVMDLVWRNYEEQVASSRRVSDRIAIVLGASVAGIGLMFKDIDLKTIESLGSQVSLVVMLVALVGGFVCACWAWVPARVGIPSGTNRDRLWHFLVAVDDDISASTLTTPSIQ